MNKPKYKCPTCGKLYSFQVFTCCGIQPKKNDPKKYVANEEPIEWIDWGKELLTEIK